MKVSECTGLNEQHNFVTAIQVYPNPARDLVVIKNTLSSTKLSVAVSDATGRVVLTGAIDSNEKKLNISNLSNGVYLLSIKEGDKQLRTIKLVKQ
jgi:hypothetical protein